MELQEYLSQPYAGAASFINTVLKPIFHDNLQEQNYDVLRYQAEYQKLADATGVKQIILVAEIEPEDSINKISAFDITISDRIRLQRNRVGIQQLVMRLIDRYDGAFMLFHYNDTDNYDWRFTYSFRGKTDSTDSALQQTDSKRYTCLLGPNQSCRTAADNFQKLIDLKGNVSIQDIRIAFDVEALSNDFFNRYKTIYADIVEYVTGKRYVKQGGTWEEKQLHEPADIMQNFLSFADPEKAVRDYVKKLMGRLVFLCFLQKKGWMGVPQDEQWGTGDTSFLQHLWEDHGKPQDFIDRVLEPLFNDLNTQRHNDLANDKVVGEQRVPYLNGGLFEKDEADKIDFPLPPQYLQSLFDLFSQYNFTIDENDPNDIQVGIDPEMLGKIFENLLEDNKDKGAFYTPKEIVQYMCRESLIAYLNTECSAILSEEQTRQFITTHNPEPLTNTQQRQVLKALKEVKICDPAIGSGAFPMGLLRELYFCRSVLENDNTRNTAAHIKKEIIQNNIYGVDIERGAVDIARLRFWLALVVDLEEPEALPNFDYKFMQGNSLLEQFEGLDLSSLLPQNANEPNGLIAFTEETTQQVLLQEYRDRYFRESDHTRKYELREKINQIVKDLIKVRTSGNQRIAQAIEPINVAANTDFFLWHTWFADVFNRASKQGFDIVIGNPPYIDSETMTRVMPKRRELYTKQYSCAKGNWDIYIAFMELSLRLSRIVCLITPDKWLSKPFGYEFRKQLMMRRLSKITHAGASVFKSATVDAIIALYNETSNEIQGLKFVRAEDIKHLSTASMASIQDPYYIDFLFSDQSSLIAKLDKLPKRIKDFDVSCEGACATSDAYKLVPLLNNSNIPSINADTYYKLVNTGTIVKYAPLWGIKQITYLGNKVICPIVSKDDFNKTFGKTYILRAQRPKIIFKGLNLLDAFIDANAEFIPGKTTLVICSEDIEKLKFLCAVINSKLVFRYIKIKYQSSSYCGGITFTSDMINLIPIPLLTSSQQWPIIDLVNTILAKKKANPGADTSVEEKAIDQLVYKLYDLNANEIKLIENS